MSALKKMSTDFLITSTFSYNDQPGPGHLCAMLFELFPGVGNAVGID